MDKNPRPNKRQELTIFTNKNREEDDQTGVWILLTITVNTMAGNKLPQGKRPYKKNT